MHASVWLVSLLILAFGFPVRAAIIENLISGISALTNYQDRYDQNSKTLAINSPLASLRFGENSFGGGRQFNSVQSPTARVPNNVPISPNYAPINRNYASTNPTYVPISPNNGPIRPIIRGPNNYGETTYLNTYDAPVGYPSDCRISQTTVSGRSSAAVGPYRY